MWRRLSLLILCCAVSGLDALEANTTADPLPVTEAAEPGKPDQDASPAATVEDRVRGGEQQSPGREPERRAQQPTAEPLEEEMDNQENVISQVSVMCVTPHTRSLMTK